MASGVDLGVGLAAGGAGSPLRVYNGASRGRRRHGPTETGHADQSGRGGQGVKGAMSCGRLHRRGDKELCDPDATLLYGGVLQVLQALRHH